MAPPGYGGFGVQSGWPTAQGERLLTHIVAVNGSTDEVLAEVFVYPSDSILGLRQAISAKSGIPHLSLRFRDAPLPDHHTVEQAGLENHSKVHAEVVSDVTLATSSSDTTVKVWSAQAGRCLTSLRGHSDQVLHTSISASGDFMATSSADFTASIWDTQTGESLLVLEGHQDWVTSVAFAQDEQSAVTGSLDCRSRIWDLQSGTCVAQLTCGVSPLFSASFSPSSSSMVLTAGADRAAKIWDVRTKGVQRHFEGHEDNVQAAAFSPDGLSIATGSQDRGAKIWQVASGKCTADFLGHTDTVESARFSPDGKLVVTASMDRTARIWDMQALQCLRVLHGHAGCVLSAAFSPDGQLIATGSRDMTVKVWHAKAGKCMRSMEGHRAKVTSVAFIPF